MKCLLSRVLRLKCYTASSPVFLTTKEQRISQTLGKIPFPTIGTITITVSGIEKQLRGLKADKAYGTDGVPPWFLKQNNQEISEFLISIKTVSIPELCPANGNMFPTYVPFTRKERNRIRQTIGPYHLLASLQKYCA